MTEHKALTEINERLSLIQLQLVALNEKHSQLLLEQQRLALLLTGNGTPESGMIVRVDRIEQGIKRRDRWAAALITTTIAALFSVAGIVIKYLWH